MFLSPEEKFIELVSVYLLHHYDLEVVLPVAATKTVAHGDFGSPLFAVAKSLARNPHELATEIAVGLQYDGMTFSALGGFLNVQLSDELLSKCLQRQVDDPRLGVEEVKDEQCVVIDYSAPNIAKTMHVGHLRSTVIGDALARLCEYQGHRVIRQNHLGDWSTQFGMLGEWLVEEESLPKSLDELTAAYKKSKKKFDDDSGWADRARARVHLLQSGDLQTRVQWQHLVDISIKGIQETYEQLGVSLQSGDIRGESSYNHMLSDIVAELLASGYAVVNDEAVCVFPGGDVDKTPLLIEKSDGGYMYGTTDLAAIKYRMQSLHADRILYVTDARQSEHFSIVFETAHNMGWTAKTRLSRLALCSLTERLLGQGMQLLGIPQPEKM